MVNKKNQNKYLYSIAIVSASLFISLSSILLIGRPLYNSIKINKEKAEEKALVLEKLEDKLKVLKSLESREEELIEKNEKTLAAIPTDKDISRLFTQFEKVANDSGVYIRSVRELRQRSGSSSSAEGTGGISEVTHEVVAETNSYSNLKTALSNFEESLRILSIDEITIRQERNSPLRINLSIKTFKRN